MATESRIPVVNIAGRLVIDGQSLAVGQICQDSLVMLDRCDVPPTAARLIVTVSGQEKVYDIFLPHGLSRHAEAVNFF